ncbi:MAG: MerR family transcriptional regulator [Oleiphilaceae bacterium]|nr:MerR family transcriptional regulator [Oleiphilaceae bacterium]
MNISEASKRCGLSPQTIRYYEQIELVTPARRQDNGYRDYRQAELEQLAFVHHARETGFSIDECRELLDLYRNPSRQSRHVHALVLEKAERVKKQIKQLQIMHKALIDLAKSCQDDHAPHCAILDNLAEHNSSKEEN